MMTTRHATIPKTASGCRRRTLRWCRDNNIAIERDNHFIYLIAPVGWTMGSNGERRQLCHDWIDAAEMTTHGVTHIEADWDLSAWPDRATDPVTAGIVADYLEERGADDYLVEQYREISCEGYADELEVREYHA